MSNLRWSLVLWLLAASLMLNQVSGVPVASAQIAAENNSRSSLEIVRDWVLGDKLSGTRGGAPPLLRMGGWILDSLQGPSAVQASAPADYGYQDPVTTPVGTLPGDFSVDRFGNANYSVPFDVPPGANGMQPALGLSYSSGRGMGMVGVGFALTGLSAIERCPKTLIHDGENEAIELEQYDAFCLDGQRLVYVGGGDGYGWPGALYRTRHDTFKRIRANGQFNDPGSSFTVQTKDGRTLTYGGDTNAHLYADSGVPFKWALSRITDKFGNYMTIQYEVEPPDSSYNGTRGQRPVLIEYTGNGTKLPQRAVTFDYELLPSDQRIEGWRKGIYYSVDHLLTQVVMHGPEGEVRAYNLAYDDETITNRPRLEELRMCDGSGASAMCMPPTVFAWSNDEAGFEDYNKAFDNLDYLEAHPDWEQECGYEADSPQHRLTLDVDADGSQDFLIARGQDNRDTYIPDARDDPCNDIYHWQMWPSRQGDISSNDMPWDGGGFEEISTWVAARYARETGLDPFYENLTIAVVNYDGDHRDDVIFVETWGEQEYSDGFGVLESVPNPGGEPYYRSVPLSSGGSNDSATILQFVTPDLNGDGFQDLMVCRGWPHLKYGYWYYILHNGNTDVLNGDPPLDGMGTYLPLECSTKDSLMVMDYDGDRNQELLVIPGVRAGEILDPQDRLDEYHAVELDFVDQWIDEFRPTGLTRPSPPRPGLGGGRIADVHGDGLQDVIRQSGGTIRVWENVGGRFVQGATLYQDSPHFVLLDQGAVLDYNADGRVDVAFTTVTMDQYGIEYTTRMSLVESFPASSRFTSSIVTPIVTETNFEQDIDPSVQPQSIVPVGDLNGDGLHDIAHIQRTVNPSTGQTMSQRWQLKVHRGEPPDILTGVTNGYGATLEIDYESTRAREDEADFLAYDPSTEWMDCSNPVECHTGARQVVSHYSEDTTDEGDKRHHQFQYEDGRTRQGWGWLGFRIVREIEVVENEITAIHEWQYDLSTFNEDIRDFPFKGVAILETHQVPVEGGHRVQQTTRMPDLRFTLGRPRPSGAFGSALSAYHFSFIGSSVVEDFEITGQCSQPISSFYGGQTTRCTNQDLASTAPLRSRETSRTFDDFGTVDFEEVTHGDGHITTTTRAIRNDDGSRWLLGLVEQEVTVDRTPLGDEKTRTWEADYDIETGALREKIQEPGGAQQVVTTLSRDVHGNIGMKSADDAWGNKRRDYYMYDDEGVFPLTHDNGLLQPTATDWYRGLGKPFIVTDANGVKQVTVRDSFGRVTTEERLDLQNNPDGAQVNHDYQRLDTTTADGPTPMAVVTTVAGGERTTVEYDRLGREVFTSTTGYFGRDVATRTRYDARGFVERVEELDDNESVVTQTETTHDNLGRPLTITTEDRITRFHYEGLLTRSIDPRDTTTETLVNERDQVVRVERYGNDAEDLVCYEYAPFGFIKKVKKACATAGSTNIVQFDPDAYGQNLAVTDPALGPRFYQYDGFGNVMWSADAKGQETDYDYDILGRLTVRDDADGTSSWSYDNNFIGAFYQSVSSDGHTVTEHHDQFGRLSTRLYSIEGRNHRVRYHYDEYSRLYWLDYPFSQTQYNAAFWVTYNFDDFGHVTQVNRKTYYDEGFYWRVLDVDHRGRVTNEEFRDKTTTERAFDPDTGTIDWITTRDKDGVVIQRLDYDYDPNLNLLTRSEEYQSSVQGESFIYDALDRVKHADTQGTFTSRQVDVDYNDNGDINWLDGVGQYNYNPSDGRLEDAGDFTFGYDENGNVVSRQVNTGGFPPPPTQFQYNALDKIRTILAPSNTLEFEYDADGQRVVRRSAAEDTTTYYIDDLMEEIWEEGASRPDRRYKVHADGRVVVQVLEERATRSPLRTSYYLHHDHLDSTTLVTGNDQVQRMYYDMWGAKRGDDWTSPGPYANEIGINVGYTGHEEQIDGGLMNMRGRMYDPKLARFMSADPIVGRPETLQGWNRYAYVENNPLTRVDPSGHLYMEGLFRMNSLVTSEATAFMSESAASFGGHFNLNGGRPVEALFPNGREKLALEYQDRVDQMVLTMGDQIRDDEAVGSRLEGKLGHAKVSRMSDATIAITTPWGNTALKRPYYNYKLTSNEKGFARWGEMQQLREARRECRNDAGCSDNWESARRNLNQDGEISLGEKASYDPPTGNISLVKDPNARGYWRDGEEHRFSLGRYLNHELAHGALINDPAFGGRDFTETFIELHHDIPYMQRNGQVLPPFSYWANDD